MKSLRLLSCEVCRRPMSFVGILGPDVIAAICDLCDRNSLAEQILALTCDERRWSSTRGAVDVSYFLVSKYRVAGSRAAEAVLSHLFFVIDEAMQGAPIDVIGDRIAGSAGLTTRPPRLSE